MPKVRPGMPQAASFLGNEIREMTSPWLGVPCSNRRSSKHRNSRQFREAGLCVREILSLLACERHFDLHTLGSLFDKSRDSTGL